MSKPIQRRQFLSRLSMALGSVVTIPAKSIGETLEKAASFDTMNANPVKQIRALGFQWETADPFLFCVHHEDHFPKGNEIMGPVTSLEGRHLGDDFIVKDGFRMYHGQRVPGFPGHPHRGFETITVVRKGIVDHADSMGAAGRYGNGDVQWMTAGKGVQHSEMFPLLSQDKENPMELFQIWLNLPAKHKMVEPHFKMMWRDAIPNIHEKDAHGKDIHIEVIAGKLGTHLAASPPPDSWAANPANEVAVWNIRMQPGAQWTIPAASAGINRTLYFYEGSSLDLSGVQVPAYSAADVISELALHLTAGPEGANILLLQGKPIGEPVIQYGPFVMNTKEEIHQAFNDYHKDQFGGWPWPVYDQVHPRAQSRFARHADGHMEIKKG